MSASGSISSRWLTAASWAAVIIWMAFIFYMSGRPEELSGSDSGMITRAIVGFLEAVGAKGRINSQDATLTLLVRKAGHFIEYVILTMFLMNALIRTQSYRNAGKVDYKKAATAAFAIAVLYAISDEVHQGFVPGRWMRASDVAIDAASSFSAVLIYMRYIVKERLF